jgi:hypothetical protein
MSATTSQMMPLQRAIQALRDTLPLLEAQWIDSTGRLKLHGVAGSDQQNRVNGVYVRTSQTANGAAIWDHQSNDCAAHRTKAGASLALLQALLL